MKCPLCGHSKAHKHGLMPKGGQRYLCPACHQTFCEGFDSLYYRRHHVSPEQIRASPASTTAKAVVGAELVGLPDLLTIRWSALCVPQVKKHNWYIMR